MVGEYVLWQRMYSNPDGSRSPTFDDASLIGNTLESQRFGQLGIGDPHPPKSLRVERFPIHTVLRIRGLKKYKKIGSRINT
jgi:hypothetical protein